MGMYDSIWVNCPKCKKESEFQSKGGDCFLANYTLENCPNDVLKDANRLIKKIKDLIEAGRFNGANVLQLTEGGLCG